MGPVNNFTVFGLVVAGNLLQITITVIIASFKNTNKIFKNK